MSYLLPSYYYYYGFAAPSDNDDDVDVDESSRNGRRIGAEGHAATDYVCRCVMRSLLADRARETDGKRSWSCVRSVNAVGSRTLE